MGYSLNSLKGGYTGQYIGEHDRGLLRRITGATIIRV